MVRNCGAALLCERHSGCARLRKSGANVRGPRTEGREQKTGGERVGARGRAGRGVRVRTRRRVGKRWEALVLLLFSIFFFLVFLLFLLL
jgi:hypothetical protein